MERSAQEDQHRRLMRARIAVDRDFAQPLNVPDLAGIALMSPAHFSRTFSAIIGRSASAYRMPATPVDVPTCVVKAWARPSSFG